MNRTLRQEIRISTEVFVQNPQHMKSKENLALFYLLLYGEITCGSAV